MEQQKETWSLPLPTFLFGRPGMCIGHLRPTLDKVLKDCTPTYLVLHVGANDIGRLDEYNWSREFELSVLYVKARWPTIQLLWSDMIPRLVWRHCQSNQGGEKARRRNQRRARAIILREGGKVIRHPSIQADPAHLLSDGVHLSHEGQALFQSTMQDGILQAVGNIYC